MAQQTAVDFIIENLPQIDWDDPFYVGLLQEAKAMEKEQIIKTYNNAISKMDYFIQPESAEQYYNETYNKTYGTNNTRNQRTS